MDFKGKKSVLKFSQFTNVRRHGMHGPFVYFTALLNDQEYMLKLRTKIQWKDGQRDDAFKHLLNEMLAAILYQSCGYLTLPYLIVENDIGINVTRQIISHDFLLAYKTEGFTGIKYDLVPGKWSKLSHELCSGFLVDSVLANLELLGKGNLGYLEAVYNDKPYLLLIRVEVSGSLVYTSRGDDKEFDLIPFEHATFHIRQHKYGRYVRYLKQISTNDVKALVERMFKKLKQLNTNDPSVRSLITYASSIDKTYGTFLNEILQTVQKRQESYLRYPQQTVIKMIQRVITMPNSSSGTPVTVSPITNTHSGQNSVATVMTTKTRKPKVNTRNTVIKANRSNTVMTTKTRKPKVNTSNTIIKANGSIPVKTLQTIKQKV